jgi:glutathione S-transferase
VANIRVYTFANLFQGLPAGGPFDLKLLAWLNLAGIPYDHQFQDDTRKGPKGKNPWIELGSERIGDTEIIIERLGKEFGVDLDAGLAPEQVATAHAWRRTFEEHFHQIFEWELLVHPAGAAFMRSGMVAKMPPVLGSVVFTMMQRGMAKQLHARGIARHSPDVIEAKGRHDIDTLSAFLEDRPFLVGDRPAVPDSKATSLCHPTELRPLTVAEYARIQQFPDDWVFEGTVRKKYEQVGNAVPIGLGAALGRALLTAARSHIRSERRGRFECFNVDLLAKLARRPKTIVNPPRMRKDDAENSLSDWYGETPRLREDVFHYVPAEHQEQLKRLLNDSRRGRTRVDAAAEHAADTASPGQASDDHTEGHLPLAAAE